jgi:hypothetical protein
MERAEIRYSQLSHNADLQITKVKVTKNYRRTWNNIDTTMKIWQGKWPEHMGKFLKEEPHICQHKADR